MVTLTQEDIDVRNMMSVYFESIDGDEYISASSEYDIYSAIRSIAVNYGNGMLKSLRNLVDAGEVIEYTRRDVGGLFRYINGNHHAYVTVSYLLVLPYRRKLNDAQLHEVEHLLRKVDRTLGMDLPTLPDPTDADIKEAFASIVRERMMANPVRFYRDFTETMTRNGTPINLKQKDFKKFFEDNFKL